MVRARAWQGIRATVGNAVDGRRWSVPYALVCGALLLVSLFKTVHPPFRWLALAAAAAGLPPILSRALAAFRRVSLDLHVFALFAVGGHIALEDYWEAGFTVFLFPIGRWLDSRASYQAPPATAGEVLPRDDVLAQNLTGKTQRIVDSYSRIYTPVIVLAEVLLAALHLARKTRDGKRWLRLAVALVASACPCALVLCTPVATFFALASAAGAGIFVEGGALLETLGRVKLVAFDETGTVADGHFSVLGFRPAGGNVSFELLLQWVSSVAGKASDPIAAALVGFARMNSVAPKTERVGGFKVFPGEGVYGEIDGRSLYIGDHRISARAGYAQQVQGTMANLNNTLVVYVFSGGELLGTFTLCENPRGGTRETIEELGRMGIKTVLLTKDNIATAMIAQKQVGNSLGGIHAEIRPEDKARILKHLLDKEGNVASVVAQPNGASALFPANLSISVGISSSTVAKETNPIILTFNDIRRIPSAIRLGQNTRYKIIENIVLSVAIKTAILAAQLVLSLSENPSPWATIISDIGISVVVILNSMRLLIASHTFGNSTAEWYSHVYDDTKKTFFEYVESSPQHNSLACLSLLCFSSTGNQTVTGDHDSDGSELDHNDIV